MPKRKQLTKTEVRRSQLVFVPEDCKRLPEGEKRRTAQLRTIAEYYLATNGKLLIKLRHDQISLKAWDYIENPKDSAFGHANAHLCRQLETVLPHWVEHLCPQSGGLLAKVSLAESAGIVLSERATRALFSYNGTPFTVPLDQIKLVRAFYPTARFYMGPQLYGRDIFGNQVTQPCPLVCRVKNVGVVALIMPFSETPLGGTSIRAE